MTVDPTPIVGANQLPSLPPPAPASGAPYGPPTEPVVAQRTPWLLYVGLAVGAYLIWRALRKPQA